MAKRLTLEKRIRLETLLKLPFSGFMDNLSMAKKLPKIAKLLEISQSTIHPNALMLRLKAELAANIKLPSVEIIYQWIYEDARNGGVLYKLLPRSHRKRKRKAVQRKEIISNKQSIHSRDEIVEERSRIGDIEIDSVVGPFNHAGIITGTKRRSRYIVNL